VIACRNGGSANVIKGIVAEQSFCYLQRADTISQIAKEHADSGHVEFLSEMSDGKIETNTSLSLKVGQKDKTSWFHW